MEKRLERQGRNQKLVNDKRKKRIEVLARENERLKAELMRVGEKREGELDEER